MGVRSATRDDLREVARIHKARFCTPDYTLGQYSVSLISKFYALFLGRCTFLVHVSQRGVNGFVLGGERGELQGVEHEFMRNHLARCCLETLLRPRLWPAAYATGRRLFPSQTKDPAPQPAPEAPACSRLPWTRLPKAAERLRNWSRPSKRACPAATRPTS